MRVIFLIIFKGSVCKVDFDRYFQSPDKKPLKKTNSQLDDYFAIDETEKTIKKRSGSI